MYRIEVDGIPPSLNAFYGGMHWAKRKAIVDEWHSRFHWAFKAAELPRLKTPITLDVTEFCKRLRDCDNAVVAAKFCGDALKAGGWIEDDTPEFVKCVVLRSEKAKADKTVIIIL